MDKPESKLWVNVYLNPTVKNHLLEIKVNKQVKILQKIAVYVYMACYMDKSCDIKGYFSRTKCASELGLTLDVVDKAVQWLESNEFITTVKRGRPGEYYSTYNMPLENEWYKDSKEGTLYSQSSCTQCFFNLLEKDMNFQPKSEFMQMLNKLNKEKAECLGLYVLMKSFDAKKSPLIYMTSSLINEVGVGRKKYFKLTGLMEGIGLISNIGSCGKATVYKMMYEYTYPEGWMPDDLKPIVSKEELVNQKLEELKNLSEDDKINKIQFLTEEVEKWKAKYERMTDVKNRYRQDVIDTVINVDPEKVKTWNKYYSRFRSIKNSQGYIYPLLIKNFSDEKVEKIINALEEADKKEREE